MEETVKFETKLIGVGGSEGIVIKQELKDFLQLKKGDEIQLSGYIGKKGKYIAIWKKEE